VDVTARFAEVVGRPEREIPLDEAALLIAAHAHPGLDIERGLTDLDALAKEAGAHDPAVLAHRLFVELGFAGNTVDYGDPRNSYLDDVLARRLGIPITLSVVMMEVGRRSGVALGGVGMPGHFLVTTGGDDPVWFDAFHDGRALDVEGCRMVFHAVHAVHGAAAEFSLDHLAITPTRTILDRMLANLHHTLMQRDPASAPWVIRLRLTIPGASPAHRRQLATALGGLGRFDEAAGILLRLSEELEGDEATIVAREGTALRARGN
jgi:regulator of sirC expression with transglutaminase-like and TPR domain